MSQFFSRFLYPLNITADNNTLFIITNLGNIPLDVPPGIYYLIEESGDAEIDGKFPSIFSAIQPLVNVSWFRPDGYKYKESLKLEFTPGPPALDFLGFNFANPDFTFPKDILGFPADINVDVVGSVSEPQTILGTRSALGAWISGTLEGGDWTSILSHIDKEVYSSTDPIYRHTKIIKMREDRIPRAFEFEFVPGLRVHGGSIRGNDIAYRELADLPEIEDGFADDGDAVSLRSMYRRVNGGEPFLVIFEDEDQIDLSAGSFESLRLYSIAEHQSFQNWYNDPIPGGEIYNVGFTGLVIDGGYGY